MAVSEMYHRSERKYKDLIYSENMALKQRIKELKSIHKQELEKLELIL